MRLLDRHVGFVRALREAGVPVSPAEGLDAARALGVVDLAERESLRAAYAATLVKKAAHRPIFDTLFDLWFPPVVSVPGSGPGRDDRDDRDAEEPGDLDADRERLAVLLAGSGEGMAAFAREMVGRYGEQAGTAGRQRWFSYPVTRALSPTTLIARVLAGMLDGRQRGGLAELMARRRVADNIRRFEEAVAADVRRRIAEDSGVERVSRSAVEPLPDRKDFLRMTRADLARLRREVQPLARRLGTRLAMRHRHGRRGRLDFRRTVRTSLSTGGVPLVTHARRPRPHRPELVILCDTSDSVAAFSHFTLLLTYALREQFTRVRAFGFVDRVDEITRFFAPGADPVSALTRLAEEADMTRFGRTNYGAALEGFAQRYGDAVGPRSSLLILGDARNNYQRLALPTLTEVAGRARHAHWLNPEPRAHWDTGDSEATAYASVVPMHECRNVPQLAAFIEDLA